MLDNSSINRRKVMKLAAGTSLTLGTSGVVSATESKRVRIVTGSLASPVSAAERADIRSKVRSAAEPYTSGGATFHTKIGPDEDPVVAYVYGIDDNGVPLEHVGTASSQEEVQKTVLEAKSVAEDFRTKIGGHSTMGSEYPWRQVYYTTHPNSNDPYGEANGTIRLYHLMSGASDQDIFAVRHEVEARPGVVVDDFCDLWSYWCSSYNIDSARSIHDWSYGNVDSIGSVGPDDRASGNVDCTLRTRSSSDYTDAEINWSFDLDGPTVEPRHTQRDLKVDRVAHWELDVGTNASEEHTIEPGSAALLDEVEDGSDILKLTTEADFFDENDPGSTTVGGTKVIQANKLSK